MVFHKLESQNMPQADKPQHNMRTAKTVTMVAVIAFGAAALFFIVMGAWATHSIMAAVSAGTLSLNNTISVANGQELTFDAVMSLVFATFKIGSAATGVPETASLIATTLPFLPLAYIADIAAFVFYAYKNIVKVLPITAFIVFLISPLLAVLAMIAVLALMI